MRLFDCHNHIQEERVYSHLEQVMVRAQEAGVVKMGVKGCIESDWSRVIEIADAHEGVHPSFGLHPWFIAGRSDQWLQILEERLMEYPQAGVGEIGIDHAIKERDDADQETVFMAQLALAQRLERPVSIHCRQAWGRLIELLDEAGELPRGMLIHCFGGSAEVAMELVKRGAYISFSGSITRPNNKKAGPAILAVPAERILIETDAPDILPQNIDMTTLYAGGVPSPASVASADAAPPNEPAFLRWVLARAAELRGMGESEFAALTFSNAERFFES